MGDISGRQIAGFPSTAGRRMSKSKRKERKEMTAKRPRITTTARDRYEALGDTNSGSSLDPNHHSGRISHATRELVGHGEAANDARVTSSRGPLSLPRHYVATSLRSTPLTTTARPLHERCHVPSQYASRHERTETQSVASTPPPPPEALASRTQRPTRRRWLPATPLPHPR
ncbi:hypothetical protein K438DRAFT_1765496 [Mycena galopus ATCC 62051]|nr:hypothetical protein K438DRAFT_1765496 [Mycena galopus ATCC 62051]